MPFHPSPIRLPVLTPGGVIILTVLEIDLDDEDVRAELARDVTPVTRLLN